MFELRALAGGGDWALRRQAWAGKTLRVVDVRDDDADQPPVLVVEDMPEKSD